MERVPIEDFSDDGVAARKIPSRRCLWILAAVGLLVVAAVLTSVLLATRIGEKNSLKEEAETPNINDDGELFVDNDASAPDGSAAFPSSTPAAFPIEMPSASFPSQPPSSLPRFPIEKDSMLNGCFDLKCLSPVPTKNTRDRLGHNAPLYKGQALCNSDQELFPGVLFQFGLTHSGALVWQNCSSTNPASDSRVEVLYNNTSLSRFPWNEAWFQMTSDATWQIRISDGASVVWEHKIQNQDTEKPIQATTCLTNQPVMQCPYIHFRRHGDIIMNFRGLLGNWIACKSRKTCYPDLFV